MKQYSKKCQSEVLRHWASSLNTLPNLNREGKAVMKPPGWMELLWEEFPQIMKVKCLAPTWPRINVSE